MGVVWRLGIEKYELVYQTIKSYTEATLPNKPF